MVPTEPQDWKNKVQVEGTDLELPSGNVARVRQISPQAFLTAGLIPDPLTAIINEAIKKKRGLPPKKVDEIMSDPEKVTSAMELFDRVLTYVAVEPKIQMPPTCECGAYYNVDDRHRDPRVEGYHVYNEQPRDPNVLYADQVEMEDKMFAFNWCLGGTRDLEQFRQEQQAGLEAVSDLQDVQQPAK